MDYSGFSDNELVEHLKNGKTGAFYEIFDRYNKVLYIFARNMLRNREEAEDLVQDVFTSLWDKAEHLELKYSLSSYLYKSVRYKFINLVAHKKIRADYVNAFQSLIDEGEYSTDHYINEKELLLLIEKEITLLPEKMREVFILSRNTGLTHQEISEKLNISTKTVKNHINHALKILRSKFSASVILLFLTNL